MEAIRSYMARSMTFIPFRLIRINLPSIGKKYMQKGKLTLEKSQNMRC